MDVSRIIEGVIIGLLVLLIAAVTVTLFTLVREGILVGYMGGLSEIEINENIKEEIDKIREEFSGRISDLESRLSRAVGLKSTTGETPTKIEFINRMPEPVDVYWINYDGEEEKFHTLGVGKSYMQDTYATHPWIVKPVSDNRQLAIIIGTESFQKLQIGDDN